jgi:beta-glucanase (GH16 family)
MRPIPTPIRYHAIRILLVLGLLAALGGWWYVSTQTVPPSPQRTKIVEEPSLFATKPSWSQDFTKLRDGPVDTTLWNPATPETPIYNEEEQVYTDRQKNVRIANGRLVLEAHAEDLAGKHFTSGRLDTKGRQNFLYGKLEATMRFPEGKGTWPAFWMLSATGKYTAAFNPTEADWEQPRFYMHDGELDIVEYIGSKPKTVESSAHTFKKSDTKSAPIPGDHKGFHTYAIEWTPTSVNFTIDGKSYHQLNKPSDDPAEWPFDQPMYAILNLAMGGRMGGEIDTKHRSWQLQIKQVAYYPYLGR